MILNIVYSAVMVCWDLVSVKLSNVFMMPT